MPTLKKSVCLSYTYDIETFLRNINMSITEKTVTQQVAELLANNGVAYTHAYIGERMREKWNCDAWIVVFTVMKNGKPHAEDFEFFTGMGCRAELTEIKKQAVKWDFPGLTDNDLKNNNLYARKYHAACEARREPKTPDAATVLHSLILDSSASEQSFDSWCDEYAYDSDSRKAFGIYEACQKNTGKLKRVLKGALIAELSELLQDF